MTLITILKKKMGSELNLSSGNTCGGSCDVVSRVKCTPHSICVVYSIIIIGVSSVLILSTATNDWHSNHLDLGNVVRVFKKSLGNSTENDYDENQEDLDFNETLAIAGRSSYLGQWQSHGLIKFLLHFLLLSF